MNFKDTIKSFFAHLKNKWFVYFTVVVLLIVVWFVLCYGQATKLPNNQVLYVWVTPNSQGEGTYYEEITTIIDDLYDNKENYGYKKLEQKVAYASKTNTEEINTFTLYADRVADLFFMPTSCFINDVDFIDKNTATDLVIMQQSNTNYCNRFIDLYSLFSTSHEKYNEYINLLNQLQNKDLIITYTGMNIDKTDLEPKVVGIQINKDYVLAISKYHSTQSDTLYDLIYDLVKDLL